MLHTIDGRMIERTAVMKRIRSHILNISSIIKRNTHEHILQNFNFGHMRDYCLTKLKRIVWRSITIATRTAYGFFVTRHLILCFLLHIHTRSRERNREFRIAIDAIISMSFSYKSAQYFHLCMHILYFLFSNYGRHTTTNRKHFFLLRKQLEAKMEKRCDE